ncbi:hypothetical protein M975_0296 [Buttiauxella brennerae ATCC 51605]|uniref:Uncharacterized protein n=1 Tax=Buttiauxella brennerae ATCC 51605 TaxID=1354251 RepID=A0A1B7IUY9_9ENTR|nr:hypothetical protein [Buttiauxella brennerae]OAT33761.1 hypothetical protein M975_0296 [Buttiauxella brennerae ATCC 51605]
MIFAWSVITFEITDQATKCQVYVKKIALYVSEQEALPWYLNANQGYSAIALSEKMAGL